jgi:ribose transport system permease protein
MATRSQRPDSGRGLLARLSSSHSWPTVIIYVVLVVMLAALRLVSPTFPSVFTVTSLVSTALPLAFAAIAQTIVILVKGIDLSVGPAMSVVMVVAASITGNTPGSVALSILVCLVLGLAIGALNGVMVAVARLQPIIVTLASASILSGVALYIMPQPGGSIPASLNVLAAGDLGFLPVSAVILAAALAGVWLPLRRSRLGQSWYAVGGNEAGAYYSGVNVGRAKFGAFLAAGFFAALGGLFLAFQTLTGDPGIGAPYTLNSIAATVIGGTALAGGRGGAVGAVGGVFVLTAVVDLLFFLQVSAYYQYVFSGAIVIVALAIVSATELLRSRRLRSAEQRQW